MDLTLYTVTDHRFFPGTVALANSLSLTNPTAQLVVLDNGLLPVERRTLEQGAAVIDIPATPTGPPTFLKPFPWFLSLTDNVALIDSDVIVTDHLGHVLELCENGRVCAYPDHPTARERWFAEWQDLLGLASTPRRQTYVNAAFVAFSTAIWPDLMKRYWDACLAVPRDLPFVGRVDHPFWALDQDVLNAILMSEVPRESIAILDERESPFLDALYDVDVVDLKTLECRYRGRRVVMMHEAWSPKPWERAAWTRPRRDAFVRLLPRLLYEDDVPIRLAPSEVPVWLRPTMLARVLLLTLSPLHRALSSLIRVAPPAIRGRVLSVARKLRR
jgi:hypothetical protein